VKETESFTGWSLAARKQFVVDETLKMTEDGVSYVLTKDVLFKSPSAAAATLSGRAINGWTAWKDKDGNTLDENLRK
jgi:predicted type IV restriction endonuclease